MRLKITNPAAAPRLVEFLLERPDCIAQRIADDEILVSILGSRRLTANELELVARVQVWLQRERDVDLELVRTPN